jgi:hypothetical protein
MSCNAQRVGSPQRGPGRATRAKAPRCGQTAERAQRPPQPRPGPIFDRRSHARARASAKGRKDEGHATGAEGAGERWAPVGWSPAGARLSPTSGTAPAAVIPGDGLAVQAGHVERRWLGDRGRQPALTVALIVGLAPSRGLIGHTASVTSWQHSATAVLLSKKQACAI